jgi:diguanylate cyclase (GGDEF)-like protein/PAS domain S-box-containing protein
MNRSPPDRDRRAPGAGWRTRWRAAHFHDYTPAAFRLWLVIASVGTVVFGWALVSLSLATPAWVGQTLAALLLVAAAAWFPIEIPRSQYSISAADAFIFTILAVLGTPAAILAAGCDGLIGAWRSTQRVTSRISTPMAAMAAMAVCGTLFEAAWAQLTTFGWSPAVAKLAALVLVSVVPFVLTTLPLMATVTLKRGQWPDLRQWFSSLSWMAAVYIAAALVAGAVQLVAFQHGPAAIGIVAVAVLSVVILLRISIAKTEAEHLAQEARISEARREAEVNQQRFAAAFAHAAIGMAIVEPGGAIVRANKALCALLRRTEAALIGEPFLAVLHPSDVELFERQAREVASREDSSAYSIELRCGGGDGDELWVALHCGRFSDPGGGVDGLIYQLHDITSRQLAESRLQHIAYHDGLTDLANRAYFHEKLAAAVEASRIDSDVRFAVMFLDLDRFKIVNDSLGHFAGNELLREVGKRLLKCLRPSDLVARLGGDEFAVLLHDQRDAEGGLRLAERMLAELLVPLSIGGNEIAPSASVGITFSDLGYRTVDELLRDADLAMYEAKAAGRGRVAVFDRTMHERIADKLSLEADLRRAIGEGELSLAFQPLFNLEPYRLVGFEALARWVHPTRGLVSPTVFVGIAEEAGHIEALTAWVLDKAVEQLAAWHRAAPHMVHVGMNVNISGRDLVQPEFVGRVLELLQRQGVSANLLTLEITESVLMSHLDMARDSLAQLRAAGVQLAIDDFGTGYSSLAYLGTLPIDCLKIDRSFVAAMHKGSENVEIVRAVLTLGHALGKKVVAEGIETPEQLATLRRLGVPFGQGYLLARPLRPEQVPALLYAPAVQPT